MLLLDKHLEMKQEIINLEQKLLGLQRKLIEYDFSIEMETTNKLEEIRRNYQNLTLQSNPKILTLPNTPKIKDIDEVLSLILKGF
jgi:phosphomevalonate kinase